jgi:Prefoldin subunit
LDGDQATATLHGTLTSRREHQMLPSEHSAFRAQVQEHTLVLQTLEPLDEGRKCFRLVGGVLVEQTVGTARPTVQGNMDNLKLVSFQTPACTSAACTTSHQTSMQLAAYGIADSASDMACPLLAKWCILHDCDPCRTRRLVQVLQQFASQAQTKQKALLEYQVGC